MTAPEAERAVQEFVAATARHDDSTHDLLRDLLAYCAGSTVAFESIYAAANAKLPQDRAGVRSVLTAFPYFVMAEPDRWLFDAEMHRKVLTALAERKLSQLPGLFGAAPSVEPLQSTAAPQLAVQTTEETMLGSKAAVSPFDFPAALAAIKASTAMAEALMAQSAAPNAPGRKAAKGTELKPSLTREQAAKLLSLDPSSVCDLLGGMSLGKPIPSGAGAIITIMSEFEWCEKKGHGYALTLSGMTIAFLERARQLQAELRLLPAYQSAEQELRQQGTLTAPRVAAVVRALPAPFRVDPRGLLMWLGWVVRERGLGEWAASGVTLSPDKRKLL